MRGRRALAAVALPLVLALTAACDAVDARRPTTRAATPADRPRARPATAGPARRTGRPPPPVADPEHAVDPPGPRTGALGPADILVYSPDPLSAETVDGDPAASTGVTGVEPLSLAQVSIENQAINVAAVDPATYRNFTPCRERRAPGGLGPGRRRRAGALPELQKQAADRRERATSGSAAASDAPDGARRRLRPADPAGRRGRQRRRGSRRSA